MTEVYSVGNLDLKFDEFDAKQALRCKNSWTNVGICSTHHSI